MGDKTSIEWTRDADGSPGATWTPIRARNKVTGKVGWHCEHASPGCLHCYSESFNRDRLGTRLPFKPGHRDDVEIYLDEKMLTQPLRWARPRMIFVCSMTDLFGEFVPDAMIDQVFAVMALAPQHTFQVLTKRSVRMRDYCSDPSTPHRVARAMDALTSATPPKAQERVVEIDGFPGYFVSDRGRVLSDRGSGQCVHCGQMVERTARARYCSKRCRQNAQYRLRTGKPMLFPASLAEMSPDNGEDGYRRVMLYRDGQSVRELVHRLVLAAFDRPALAGEQGRHRDGSPSNNWLANLSWGDQSANWDDRRRHGSFRSYAKLTQEQATDIKRRFRAGETGVVLGREFGISDTQARNIGGGQQWAVAAPIQWPLPNCWKGVSAEDQRWADERVPDLLATPAAVRFVSAEPLLGPLDLRDFMWPVCGWWRGPYRSYAEAKAAGGECGLKRQALVLAELTFLDWAIVGGESGPKARPMHPQWARDIRDQCAAARIAFHFKQWGEFGPVELYPAGAAPSSVVTSAGRHLTGRAVLDEPEDANAEIIGRFGKARAGRRLDGVEHNGMPGGARG